MQKQRPAAHHARRGCPVKVSLEDASETGEEAFVVRIVAQQFATGFDQSIHLLIAQREAGRDPVEVMQLRRLPDILDAEPLETGLDALSPFRHFQRPAIQTLVRQFQSICKIATGILTHGASGSLLCRDDKL